MFSNIKMKKLFFTVFFIFLIVCLFAQEGQSISVIQTPHYIEAKVYEDETCSIFVKLNKKTAALYLFGGVSDDALLKYVKLLNAEFYEEETIDRRLLTDWMNSKVATAIKIESDEDDLLSGALSFLVFSTLQFELTDLEDDVYIYKINTTLSKYFE